MGSRQRKPRTAAKAGPDDDSAAMTHRSGEGGTMNVRTRVVRLERQLPPPAPPSPEELQRERCWRKISHRFRLLVRQADALLTEAERAAIDAVLQKCGDGRGEPF